MNIQAVSAYIQAEQVSKPQNGRSVQQQQTQQKNGTKAEAGAEEKKMQSKQQQTAGNAEDLLKKTAPERTVFTQRGALVQNYAPKGTLFDKVG